MKTHPSIEYTVSLRSCAPLIHSFFPVLQLPTTPPTVEDELPPPSHSRTKSSPSSLAVDMASLQEVTAAAAGAGDRQVLGTVSPAVNHPRFHKMMFTTLQDAAVPARRPGGE